MGVIAGGVAKLDIVLDTGSVEYYGPPELYDMPLVKNDGSLLLLPILSMWPGAEGIRPPAVYIPRRPLSFEEDRAALLDARSRGIPVAMTWRLLKVFWPHLNPSQIDQRYFVYGDPYEDYFDDLLRSLENERNRQV